MNELNCTCFRLRKAARRVSQLYDRHLAPTGLNVNQLGTLALIAAGGALSKGALAELAGADASTVTRTLKPLLAAGLVENVPAGDGRVRAVRLSAAGNDRLRAALAPWRAAEREVARALGEADGAHLRGLLARVAQVADEAAAPVAALSPPARRRP